MIIVIVIYITTHSIIEFEFLVSCWVICDRWELVLLTAVLPASVVLHPAYMGYMHLVLLVTPRRKTSYTY